MTGETPGLRILEYRGTTSVYVDAEIDKNGNLLISGQDVGEAPLKHFGDSDYEYWILVPKDQKDLLLLTLLQTLYSDDMKLITNLTELMKKHGIHYEFDSYA